MYLSVTGMGLERLGDGGGRVLLRKLGGNDSRIERKKWRRDWLILKEIRVSYVEHWSAMV